MFVRREFPGNFTDLSSFFLKGGIFQIVDRFFSKANDVFKRQTRFFGNQ